MQILWYDIQKKKQNHVIISPTMYKLPISHQSYHQRYILILVSYCYYNKLPPKMILWNSYQTMANGNWNIYTPVSLPLKWVHLSFDLNYFLQVTTGSEAQVATAATCLVVQTACSLCSFPSHSPFPLFQIHPKLHSNLLSQDLLWWKSNIRDIHKKPKNNRHLKIYAMRPGPLYQCGLTAEYLFLETNVIYFFWYDCVCGEWRENFQNYLHNLLFVYIYTYDNIE